MSGSLQCKPGEVNGFVLLVVFAKHHSLAELEICTTVTQNLGMGGGGGGV